MTSHDNKDGIHIKKIIAIVIPLLILVLGSVFSSFDINTIIISIVVALVVYAFLWYNASNPSESEEMDASSRSLISLAMVLSISIFTFGTVFSGFDVSDILFSIIAAATVFISIYLVLIKRSIDRGVYRSLEN